MITAQDWVLAFERVRKLDLQPTPDVSRAEMLAVLDSIICNSDPGGECRVPIFQLVAWTGLIERSVRRTLRLLEDLGFLERRSPLPGQGADDTYYSILSTALEPLAEPHPARKFGANALRGIDSAPFAATIEACAVPRSGHRRSLDALPVSDRMRVLLRHFDDGTTVTDLTVAATTSSMLQACGYSGTSARAWKAIRAELRECPFISLDERRTMPHQVTVHFPKILQQTPARDGGDVQQTLTESPPTRSGRGASAGNRSRASGRARYSQFLAPKAWRAAFRKAGVPCSERNWPRLKARIPHLDHEVLGPKMVAFELAGLRRLGIAAGEEDE